MSIRLTSMIRSGLRVLGVDRAVGTTVLTRVGQGISTILLLALVSTKLSQVKQGYYFTFSSIAAMQVFFELGLTFVLLQLASHEVARLVQREDGRYEGEHRSKARLSSLLRFAIRWYSAAAMLVWLLVLPGGYWFFWSSRHAGLANGWQLPWTLLVLSTGLTLLTNSVIAVFEGCGHVSQVAALRLTETIIGTSAAAVLLLSGNGLFAPASITISYFLVESSWLAIRKITALDLWHYFDRDISISWKDEVWPFQWKIAVSWLCGYFLFQVFIPITFKMSGPVQSGKMGMTITACMGITTFAMAWITTKAPKMGSLVSLGLRKELDELFFTAAKTAIGMAMCMAFVFWCLVTLGQYRHVGVALRFTDPLSLALMLIGAVANCVWFAEGNYIRAHKVELFVNVSVVSAILNVIGALLLAHAFGARGVAICFATTTVSVGIVCTNIFVKKRKEWSDEARAPLDLATAVAE